MTTLAEPAVLAAAKDALSPDVADHPDQYTVTETQFTTATLGSEPIPDAIHGRLQPFNSVRLASGEPDLLTSSNVFGKRSFAARSVWLQPD